MMPRIKKSDRLPTLKELEQIIMVAVETENELLLEIAIDETLAYYFKRTNPWATDYSTKSLDSMELFGIHNPIRKA